jgi:hypothetical protein
MAARHNEYGRLLGTVENNIIPLKEQANDLPMSGVPDLETIAEDCGYMADQLKRHSDNIKNISHMQPSFDEQFSGADSALGGL